MLPIPLFKPVEAELQYKYQEVISFSALLTNFQFVSGIVCMGYLFISDVLYIIQ
jgi:hypothetical protein